MLYSYKMLHSMPQDYTITYKLQLYGFILKF